MVQKHQINARRYSVTMDGIIIGAAVLCVVALVLLLTAKIEPARDGPNGTREALAQAPGPFQFGNQTILTDLG